MQEQITCNDNRVKLRGRGGRERTACTWSTVMTTGVFGVCLLDVVRILERFQPGCQFPFVALGFSPTDNDERVVDVDAAKSVGGFTDVGARIVRLHLLDAQSVLQHPEARPAAVDVAAVLGPHDERRGVAVHGARQLHGATQADALPVIHPLGHPGGTWTAQEERGRYLDCETVDLIISSHHRQPASVLQIKASNSPPAFSS